MEGAKLAGRRALKDQVARLEDHPHLDAAELQVGDDPGHGRVVVPGILGNRLVVPPVGAGIGVHRDHRVGEQRIADAEVLFHGIDDDGDHLPVHIGDQRRDDQYGDDEPGVGPVRIGRVVRAASDTEKRTGSSNHTSPLFQHRANYIVISNSKA